MSGHVIRRSTATTSGPLRSGFRSPRSRRPSRLLLSTVSANNHGESRKQHRSPGGDHSTARPFGSLPVKMALVCLVAGGRSAARRLLYSQDASEVQHGGGGPDQIGLQGEVDLE